uniref:Uncharacterized protein n=1 Tax=Rangifer tarandus platyrhynchus TaxID=3082113 RepID=A0ACB0F4U1_RANTA|nr:unnamed protein product [Rangifer tarandus platyrhynchus]
MALRLLGPGAEADVGPEAGVGAGSRCGEPEAGTETGPPLASPCLSPHRNRTAPPLTTPEDQPSPPFPLPVSAKPFLRADGRMPGAPGDGPLKTPPAEEREH